MPIIRTSRRCLPQRINSSVRRYKDEGLRDSDHSPWDVCVACFLRAVGRKRLAVSGPRTVDAQISKTLRLDLRFGDVAELARRIAWLCGLVDGASPLPTLVKWTRLARAPYPAKHKEESHL